MRSPLLALTVLTALLAAPATAAPPTVIAGLRWTRQELSGAPGFELPIGSTTRWNLATGAASTTYRARSFEECLAPARDT